MRIFNSKEASAIALANLTRESNQQPRKGNLPDA
jgi:hypothetical protein